VGFEVPLVPGRRHGVSVGGALGLPDLPGALGRPGASCVAPSKVIHLCLDFSWDERKAAANLKKHGVSFDEAATVFADPLALAIDDLLEPERTLLLGMSNRQRARGSRRAR
jgi:hypothetical protein